jgi:hypothetical protein
MLLVAIRQALMMLGKASGLIVAIALTSTLFLGNCLTSHAQGPIPDAPVPAAAVEHASTFV